MLITLAIIGIVAALTIPTVVHKYQNKAQYTAFMKMYNTLSNALQLAAAEEGSPAAWDYTIDKKAFMDKYIVPYVKNQGYKSYASSDTMVKDLAGQDSGTISQIIALNSMPDPLILNDGSAIVLAYRGSPGKRVSFVFDTNGLDKGPNIMGRDLFTIQYGYDTVSNKPMVGFFDETDDNYLEACCDANSNSCTGDIQGETCAAKLLKEGKMNY